MKHDNEPVLHVDYLQTNFSSAIFVAGEPLEDVFVRLYIVLDIYLFLLAGYTESQPRFNFPYPKIRSDGPFSGYSSSPLKIGES